MIPSWSHNISFQDFLEALPDPALLLDPQDRVFCANRFALYAFTSLQIGHFLIKTLRNSEILEAVQRVRAQGYSEVLSWRQRVPVERVYDVHIGIISSQLSHPPLLIVFKDLTEIRQVDRVREDFIANASHELRTPLTSLLGFIETLQGPARHDSERHHHFLSIMHEQGRRMARLIEDLLSLSRIEKGQHKQPRTLVNMVAIVSQVIESLHLVLESEKIDLDFKYDEALLEVYGDYDELIRVVENLLDNAIKYGIRQNRERHPIGLMLSQQADKKVRLDVTDQGWGIASEHLPRLTERFYRVEPRDGTFHKGTGLGLALVKHIVSHHRGQLEIQSQLSVGSTFTLILPMAEKGS